MPVRPDAEGRNASLVAGYRAQSYVFFRFYTTFSQHSYRLNKWQADPTSQAVNRQGRRSGPPALSLDRYLKVDAKSRRATSLWSASKMTRVNPVFLPLPSIPHGLTSTLRPVS